MIDLKPVSFNIDYLRVFLLKDYPSISHLFEGLSQNSNYTEFDFLFKTFQVNYLGTGQREFLILHYETMPVIQIEKVLDVGIVKNFKYCFKFYGAFFFFPELFDLLYSFHEKYPCSQVGRCDIALDLPISMSEFLDSGFRTQFKKQTKINEVSGIPETLYIGTKHYSNKNYFFRVYNKIKDIEKKSKVRYYTDYYKWENIIRIEIQLNSQACRNSGISFPKIFDPVFFENVFLSYSKNSNGTYFNILDRVLFDKKRITPISTSANLREKTEIEKLISSFCWTCDRLSKKTLSKLELKEISEHIEKIYKSRENI